MLILHICIIYVISRKTTTMPQPYGKASQHGTSKLFQYLKSNNVTFSEFQSSLGLTNITAHNYLSKPDSMRLYQLKELSIVLGLPIKELFNVCVGVKPHTTNWFEGDSQALIQSDE